MLTELSCKNKVVGLKQTLRAIREKTATTVFLAKDASPDIYDRVVDLCSVDGVKIVYADTMKQLGSACKIDVPSAVAAVLKS